MTKLPLDTFNAIWQKGHQQGRVDKLNECIDILNNSIPLVDNTDILFGFKCAIERLEQLKEQKNDNNGTN